VLHEAFYVASSGPSRPSSSTSEGRAIRARRLYAAAARRAQDLSAKLDADMESIREAVKLMAAAKRPIFYTGAARHQFRPGGLDAAARTGEPHGLSHHLDADGSRRLSGLGPELARHARHARHL